jgi:hypothetical protein
MPADFFGIYSLVCSQLIGLVEGTGAVVEYKIESVEGKCDAVSGWIQDFISSFLCTGIAYRHHYLGINYHLMIGRKTETKIKIKFLIIVSLKVHKVGYLVKYSVLGCIKKLKVLEAFKLSPSKVGSILSYFIS